MRPAMRWRRGFETLIWWDSLGPRLGLRRCAAPLAEEERSLFGVRPPERPAGGGGLGFRGRADLRALPGADGRRCDPLRSDRRRARLSSLAAHRSRRQPLLG